MEVENKRGKPVKIWLDEWVPGHHSLVSKGVVVREETRFDLVDSLFVDNEKMWDIHKLRSLFNPTVVADILKILLCSADVEYKRVWSHERNDMFNVKSCYRFIYAQVGSQIAETSNRACKDGLPTGMNLVQKHVLIDATCTFCLSESEDLHQALVSCVTLQRIWQSYYPGLVIDKRMIVFELALKICEGTMSEKLPVFFALAWSFCYRRNKYVHDQLLLSPKHVVDNALTMLRSYDQLDVDGAAFTALGKIGVGAVLRDALGLVLMAVSKSKVEVEDTAAIELLAFQRVAISESLLIVEALQENSMDNFGLGVLYHEIKKLSFCFGSCLFSHVYQEGNMAAHTLAKNACKVESINMRWDYISNCISQVIWLDNYL
ncbi:hypothetical protein I3843_14G049500 [Carya illinoinensis]|nr:hypothetical protein I3843_14G049500 [Carya illinoinensis]